MIRLSRASGKSNLWEKLVSTGIKHNEIDGVKIMALLNTSKSGQALRRNLWGAVKKPANAIITTLLLTAISACGGGNNSNPPPPPPPPPPANSAPQFTSATSVSVDERTNAVFYTAAATDDDGDAITFSLAGPDAGAFTFDSTANTLAFTAAADFEIPGDADTDNIYDVIISASDGTDTTMLNLAVSVTDVRNIPLRVTRVGVGLDRPIYATGAGDDSDRLFIVEQMGRIQILDLSTNTLLAAPFLDISSMVSNSTERGLLGLAFAPDYATSGLFYVDITNLAGDTEILEFQVDATNPDLADPASQRLILTFPQPFNMHQAGWIDFGDDGYLYIASGDGGGAGDPLNNAQDTSTLLGTMLRIDVTGDDFPADSNANYAIPADNPLVGQAGRDEIFAWGLRNPFRPSFDPATGDLIIADVGQDEVEEIDIIRSGTSGQNFGWNLLEGTMTFLAGSTAGFTDPVAEYFHNDGALSGVSITGGYVHRGSVEALFGEYVFADFVTGNVWSIPVDDLIDGQTVQLSDFIVRTAELTAPDFGNIANISSFAEDDDGELYIIEIFRNEIFRIENDE